MHLCAFGALWCILIKHLSAYWTADAEYSYGWFGPVFVAYLGFSRWVTRPPAEPARSAVAEWLFGLAAVAVWPTWMVVEPNPDWRLVSWALALETVTLSLCAVYFAGGRPWLTHFAFSICLILTTVPWPQGMEDAIVYGLMPAATAATVGLLHLVRIPALQHGNLIEVANGLLGVSEACSGLRSLQATVLVSLFLGGLYQASWSRKILLLICGGLVAFAYNVGRIFVLSAVAANRGTDAVSQWHDFTGIAVLGCTFLTLWGIARWVAGPLPILTAMTAARSAPNALPAKLLGAFTAWVLFTVVATETWYRVHETRDTVHWSFEWPTANADFTPLPIPEVATAMLGYDEGRAASWTEAGGARWTAFFLRWAAGPIRSQLQARLHRPELCLSGAGYKLLANHGTLMVRSNGLTIPFEALDFEYEGRRAYVFYGVWEDGSERSGNLINWADLNRLAKLEMVFLGKRNLGQQALEMVAFGYESEEQAEAALQRRMDDSIRVQPRTSARPAANPG